MSLYSTSGARPAATPVIPAGALAGRVPAQQTAPATGKVAAELLAVEPVAFQDDMVSLSKQGLQARGISGGGASTSESALNLMNTFAKRLFGDEVNIASVAYNMQSFQSASSMTASRTSVDGVTGVASTSFDLSQSASFIGTGELVTNDGRSFNFEISIKYEARSTATTSASSDTAPIEFARRNKMPQLEAPDQLVLTGTPLPAIKFPGGLDELFRLLSRELRSTVADGDNPENQGSLTLRLMRLVDQAALLAPRARPDDPDIAPAERARLVATTYGSTASTVGIDSSSIDSSSVDTPES